MSLPTKLLMGGREMAQFRKKPVVIEATQFLGDLIAKDPDGVCRCDATKDKKYGINMPHVHTLEGPLQVSVDDWIITGIKGEQYPCKPDIFEETYEPV